MYICDSQIVNCVQSQRNTSSGRGSSPAAISAGVRFSSGQRPGTGTSPEPRRSLFRFATLLVQPAIARLYAGAPGAAPRPAGVSALWASVCFPGAARPDGTRDGHWAQCSAPGRHLWPRPLLRVADGRRGGVGDRRGALVHGRTRSRTYRCPVIQITGPGGCRTAG